MSDFNKNFEEFKTTLWRKPEEIALMKLIKKKNINSIEELEDIIKSNSNLFELTSDKFKNFIKTKLHEKMQNTKIRNGLDYWDVTLNERTFTIVRDRDNLKLEGYIRRDGSLFWDKPFLVPKIVKEHCENYVIKNRSILKESDTSDFNVPIKGEFKDKEREKRMKVFNPYKTAMENKFITHKMFKESVKGLDVDSLFIISENFDTTDKNISLIVESKGEKRMIYIPKAPFVSFVEENCNVSHYVSLGTFLFETFMKNRPLGFKNQLIREFIENEITEIDKSELVVNEVEKMYSANKVKIYYTYGTEEEVETVSDEDFFNFCLDNDENANKYLININSELGDIFDEDSYMANEDLTEIAKAYLLNKKIV